MSGKGQSVEKGERVAKVMARAGLCSRREAEAWIVAGRVAVNGATISSPALNVSDRDRIVVDGTPLPQRERTRLFLYHKPRGLVTTHVDPEGRPTIFQALPTELPRLISVGRLDLGTEGLLLLTNDGGLARVLELPATGWLRRYRVRAHGTVSQPALDGLRDGIAVDGVQYGAIEATLDRVQGSNVWLTFAIREGKNREVRNVLRALELSVNRLIRVSFGPFQLAELPEGGIEEVKTRTLRDQLGERLTRLAGADFSAALLSLPVAGVLRSDPPARKERESKPVPRVEAAPARSAREPGQRRGKGAHQAAAAQRPRSPHPSSVKPGRSSKGHDDKHDKHRDNRDKGSAVRSDSRNDKLPGRGKKPGPTHPRDRGPQRRKSLARDRGKR